MTLKTLTTARTLVALTAATLLAAGCGGSGGNEVSTVSASTTPSDTGAPQLTDQQAPPSRLVVDVTIKGGQVDPTNAQLESKVGSPIVIRVNSDAADELHVHSTPEHSFKIEAKPGQSFQFTVDVPGKVDVELHQLNRTIATIQVQ